MPSQSGIAPIALHRILCATDFSPAASAALSHAAVIAGHFGSELYIAHVIAAKEYASAPPAARDTAFRRIRDHVEEQMNRLRESSLLRSVPHQVLIEEGEIWPALSAIVDRRKVDLMVIGTHGLRGLEKLVLGSTAEEILSRADCPVMMVGPGSSINPQAESHLHRILYATDFSTESEPALRYAYRLAKEFKSQLFFLHVVEDVWKETVSTRMSPADLCRLRLLQRGWPASFEGVEPEFLVEFGPAADCIVEEANNVQSELIVLGVQGSRHPEVVAHLPGPTAYDVMSRSRCPVLAVPDGHAAATKKTAD